jgi:hypothetical protein
MKRGRARALLWSPVLVVAALRWAGSLGLFPGPVFGWVFAGVTFGYYLLTGFLTTVAGWQAFERHSGRLALAAGAGALVTAAAAAPLLVWPVVSWLRDRGTQLDIPFFLCTAGVLAVPGALLGLLGGWAARRERVLSAT